MDADKGWEFTQRHKGAGDWREDEGDWGLWVDFILHTSQFTLLQELS